MIRVPKGSPRTVRPACWDSDTPDRKEACPGALDCSEAQLLGLTHHRLWLLVASAGLGGVPDPELCLIPKGRTRPLGRDPVFTSCW